MTGRARKSIAPFVAAALVAGITFAGASAAGMPTTAVAATNPQVAIGPARVATKSAPLVLPVNAGRRADLQLRVNGKHVRDQFQFAGRRLHVADLSLSDGLRPGVNRLRVRAVGSGGASTTGRKVRIPRSALLADAGNDQGALAKEAAQVGAEPDGPSATPGLKRKWRIVERPSDADVTLSHRHRAQPVIQARTAGTYVLRLKAHLSGSRRTSYDTVTVPVSPPDPPIGAPIDTLGANGAITIGGDAYGASTDDQKLAYVVLERTTRAVALDDHGNPVAGNVGGSILHDLPKLVNIAKQYSGSDKYLMIVSGRHAPFGDTGDFSSFLKQLGAPLLTRDQVSSIQRRAPFSVIGIPGADAGAATVRFPRDDSGSGSIKGYLENNQAVDIDGTPIYDYVSTERPIYDTRAPGSDDATNVMTIGPDRYQASFSDTDIPGANAGFHLVILDGQTLQLQENRMLTTNGDGSIPDTTLQSAIADFLQGRMGANSVVLLQTVGKPKPAGPEWSGIVAQLRRLGANSNLVNALDGTTGYAIVGQVDSDEAPAEATTASGNDPAPKYPPARLTGPLVRDRASNFGPLATAIPTPKSPTGGLNLDLTKIAYQPLQSWPQLNPAAEHFICQALNFCQASDSCPDLRSCYWQNTTASWGTKLTTLNALMYPGGDPGFTVDQFNAAKTELFTEISKVDQVKNYFDQLGAFMKEGEGRYQLDLKDMFKAVSDSANPPPGADASVSPISLVSSIAGIFSVFEAPVGTVGTMIGTILGFGGSFSDASGQPILDDELDAKVSDLQDAIGKRIDLARQEIFGLELLILSDYGKLTAAFPHIDADWALPDPKSAQVTSAQDRLRLASKQWFYEELVPVAYPYLIRGNAANARQMNCRINSSTHTEAWPNQPDSAQMQATTGFDEAGSPITSNYFFTRGILGGSSPTSALSDLGFNPVKADPQGRLKLDALGIEKLSFFTPGEFNGQITHAVKGTDWCDVGWLPHFP